MYFQKAEIPLLKAQRICLIKFFTVVKNFWALESCIHQFVPIFHENNEPLKPLLVRSQIQSQIPGTTPYVAVPAPAELNHELKFLPSSSRSRSFSAQYLPASFSAPGAVGDPGRRSASPLAADWGTFPSPQMTSSRYRSISSKPGPSFKDRIPHQNSRARLMHFRFPCA